MLRKVPLIVIMGSTGTGKTKLSLEIAERFGGEIISADSMQVYANLDIVTAKATKEEQMRVRHHLLDVASPSEPFTVVQFRNAALPIIENLLEKSRCPIVVGGTNYYIESLLWDILVSPPSSDRQNTTGKYSSDISELELKALPSSKLYEQLKQIDPLTAERIHPNNKRKIIRAIEVYNQTGLALSTILKEQRSKPGGNRLGGPLRYPHTILFWLQCNQDILNCRLDKRIDSMLEQGLLEEIRSVYEKNLTLLSKDNFSKGLSQTIGFKEFVPYLQKYDRSQDDIISKYLESKSYKLSDKTEENEPHGLNLLRSCLEELKLVTKRYSKRQTKWIKNRFLASQNRQVPSVYALNTSNVDLWDLNVSQPALNVIESYINNKDPEITPLSPIEHPGSGLNEEVSNYCDVCKRHFVGEFQWYDHLKSKKHKRAKDGQRRREKAAENHLNTK